MLMVISPAKTLDTDTPPTTSLASQCDFLDAAEQLIAILRPMSLSQVAQLMDLSDKLAALNVARYEAWCRPLTADSAKQALLMFNGDVYEGLDASSLSEAKLKRAQKHLRILSGLYGLLRPLDLMLPYRLEMGTALANPAGRDLYAFWGDRLGRAINTELESHKTRVLINLASDEYFRAVRGLQFPVVAPVFQERKPGGYKVVSFNAKRARGLMVRWVIDQGIDRPGDLIGFDVEDYRHDPAASTDDRPVFRRG
jgi:cytoplasmic iron level regulating protein YaaA (DUF328/UPF0246 family)